MKMNKSMKLAVAYVIMADFLDTLEGKYHFIVRGDNNFKTTASNCFNAWFEAIKNKYDLNTLCISKEEFKYLFMNGDFKVVGKYRYFESPSADEELTEYRYILMKEPYKAFLYGLDEEDG